MVRIRHPWATLRIVLCCCGLVLLQEQALLGDPATEATLLQIAANTAAGAETLLSLQVISGDIRSLSSLIYNNGVAAHTHNIDTNTNNISSYLGPGGITQSALISMDCGILTTNFILEDLLEEIRGTTNGLLAQIVTDGAEVHYNTDELVRIAQLQFPDEPPEAENATFNPGFDSPTPATFPPDNYTIEPLTFPEGIDNATLPPLPIPDVTPWTPPEWSPLTPADYPDLGLLTEWGPPPIPWSAVVTPTVALVAPVLIIILSIEAFFAIGDEFRK